jgi:hypothetical protein
MQGEKRPKKITWDDKGTIKYCKNSMHQKNETLHATNLHSNVVQQLDLGDIGKKKKKTVYFVVVFYLLREGCPLMDYESFKDLFYFFKVKNMPKKHWFNNLGWKMAGSIHDVVLECTKEVIKESPFFALYTNEVTKFHTEFWISIHGYVLENW